MSERRLWRYLGETSSGDVERGEIAAASRDQAASQLAARGVIAVEIRPADRKQTALGPLSSGEVANFTEELAELLTAGLPLQPALASLQEGEKRRRLKAFIERLEVAVRSGRSLSDALRTDPASPPRILVALTAAGEESGELAAGLKSLAARLKRAQTLSRELIGQLVYPLALIALIFLTLVFLAFFVLPQFEGVFADAAVQPPAETRFVLAVAAFLRAYAVWIPAGLVAVVWLGQQGGARFPRALSLAKRGIPVLGSALWRLDAASFARTLGVLLEAGLPLSRAESVARDAVSDAAMRDGLTAAATRLRGGVPLSTALDEYATLPGDLVRQIRLGEETGELGQFLIRAADRYERSAQMRLTRAVELLGPVLIVILGACVAGVIAAVMSGVLSLNDAVF
jgi:general secretion pathway protein F